MPRTASARLSFALIVAALTYATAAHAQVPTISGYVLVSQRAVTRTTYEFVYRGLLANAGRELVEASASASSSSPNTTVVEGALSFGPVAPGATATSLDTFTIRHNRSLPFDPQVLTALRALGHTVNAPADIGSVQFVAIDPRTGRLYGGADARREGTVIGVGKPGRD